MQAKILIRKGLGAGEEMVLDPAGTVFGRGDEADVPLPDRAASRLHCSIGREGGHWVLRDLTSKNGTSVNGVPVESAPLKFGDLIQVGLTTLQLLPHETLSQEATNVFAGGEGTLQETLSILPGPADPTAAGPVRESKTRRFRNQMEGLRSFLDRAEAAEDSEALLTQALETLLRITPATRGSAVLFEGTVDSPSLRVTRAREGCDGTSVFLHRDPARRALAEGRGLLFRNLALDPDLPEARDATQLFYSALYAPLGAGSRSPGVLYLDTLGGSDELGELDLEAALLAAGVVMPRLDRLSPYPSLRHGRRDREAPRFGMIGGSVPMKELFDQLRRAAQTSSTVLIRGESGTGKELVARALHRFSCRGEGPFEAINCSAIPDGLLESELFGHEKGAFTGAAGRRRGRFELASRGVLFLDEIGELPLDSQVKLLRAVEEKVIRRLGGTEEIGVDVRLVAATNRDLVEAVRTGAFREDLYFRLSVIALHVPPLRERPEDIPLLADYFLEMFREEIGHRICEIEPEAMAVLRDYPWPGNVRELRNVLERTLVLATGATIGARDLAFLSSQASPGGREDSLLGLKEVEHRHIRKVLDRVGWNKSKAAKILGIERSTLYEKIRLYGIREKD